MHFTITTPSTTGAAALLAGASGDVVRPDRFSGALDVALGGQRLSVKVVSVAGSVWAQLFCAGWAKVDPGRFGVHDPGTLLAPQGGLADLLTAATGATSPARSGAGAEVLRRWTRRSPARRRRGAHHDRPEQRPCPRSSASTTPPASCARPR